MGALLRTHKNPVTQNLEFVKQAKQGFTNWPEVALKGPDNIFCHVRKLPLDNFQMRPFGLGNCFLQRYGKIEGSITHCNI